MKLGFFPEIGELAGGPEVDVTDLAIAAVLIQLTKTPAGLRTIQVLGKAFLDGIFKTLGFMGQASAANKVAAWGNPVLISGILERFGFLKPGFNSNYHLGLTIIAGASVAESILGAIAGFIPFGKPADSSYPDSITFAAEVGEQLTQEGWTPEQATELIKSVKGK